MKKTVFIQKKARLFRILTVALSLVVLSCSKQDALVNNSQDKMEFRSSLFVDRWSIASNPENYLDSIGVIHNLTLDYITNKSKKAHIDSIYSYAKAYYVNERGYSPDFDNWNVGEAVQRVKNNAVSLNNGEFDSFEELATWYGYDGKSKAYQDYIRSLFAIMDSANDFCNDSSDDVCIAYLHSAVIDEIKLLEHTVLLDNLLNISDKEQFLRTSSVLRYSLLYWTNTIDTASNTGASKRMKPFWKDLIVAVADAVGSAVGATYCDTFGVTSGVASAIASHVIK